MSLGQIHIHHAVLPHSRISRLEYSRPPVEQRTANQQHHAHHHLRHYQAIAQSRRSDAAPELTAQRQLNQLRVDLQNATIAVRQARARYDSAVKQRQLQEQTLDAEQKKYTLGASTAFFVIQYQNQLAQSQSSEVAARAAYAKARVELSRVTGSTLTENNIEIAEAVAGRLSRAPDAIPAQ